MAQSLRKTAFTIGPACRERFLPLDRPAGLVLRDLGVHLAGISDLARPYEIGRPGVDFHCVLYTVSGAGWCELEGLPPSVGPGDMLVLPAGTSYGYGIAADSWRILWFHFDDGRGLGQALHGRKPAIHAAASIPRLQAAMEGFLAEARETDPESLRAAGLHAELIACYLGRELAADIDPRVAAVRHRLQKLWDDVDRDLRHPWSVAALAGRVHESQINLYRLCARHFRVKPMAMVTRLRMERAKQLLRETDEPLKRIADWVGYHNEFAFSTAFKRFTGSNPRDFRKRKRS
ncbi:MAG: AraC family transcriptional regulator [Planctomycetes bacterium]|nr:AraC family transcriptional regulator [Planctomycetota bacterium]